jgi:hypothetical protein
VEIEKLFNGFFNDNPVPAWYKGFDKRSARFYMAQVNEAYTEATGVTTEAFEGNLDTAVFEQPSSEVFYLNDLYVSQKRIRIPVEERLVNPKTRTVQYAIGFKWPQIERRAVKGVWGVANLFDAEMWERVRHKHPHYLKNQQFMDERWKEVYGTEPPQGEYNE